MSLQLRPPNQVVAAVIDRWPDIGPEWALSVSDELTQLCAKFDAEPVRVLPARYGFLVAVTAPNRPMVLRASPDPAGRVQAEVSRALATIGAGPAIYEVAETATGTWIAMEQIDPGLPLNQADPSFDLVPAVVKLLRSLNERPAPIPDMRRIDQWLWERLNDDRLADVAPGQFRAQVGERLEALRILGDLADQSGCHDLCHGDLHPGNVLARADGRLFLVDPRGVSGELAYDVAVLAIKAVRGEPATARKAATQLASCVGVDAGRTEGWVRVATAARV